MFMPCHPKSAYSEGKRPISLSQGLSQSASEKHQIQDQNNQMMSLEHFDRLMDKINDMSAGVDRIERRQNNISAQLADCSATIKEHAQTLSDHRNYISSCESNIVNILVEDISGIFNKVSALEKDLSSMNGDSSPKENTPEILDRVSKAHVTKVLTKLPHPE
ncbi:hypothetical protein HHI36_000376 [Cryptolaemus montrouzieri]|uniref:Uncharacterized protein n=1 Tax=Cryptolaemus montrouzieri TaxID=559131 RepID=A0ABD2P4G7_9CUCU